MNNTTNTDHTVNGMPGKPKAALSDTLRSLMMEHSRLASGGYLLVGAILAFLLLRSTDAQRLALVLGAAIIAFYLITKSPWIGIPLIVVYMIFLGTIRRLAVPYFGYTGFDPLQVLAPLVTLTYMSFLLINRNIHCDTRLALWISRLLLLMLLEMFNPLQGSLTVGIAGALFYIAPLGWFYLGRSFGYDGVVKRVLLVGGSLAFLSALYGLYQMWFGFQSWELEWMKYNKASALFLGTGAKPFSFFSSSAEYAHFIAIGLLIAWAAVLRGNRFLPIFIPVFVLALFLASSRGMITSSLFAMCVLWAVQGKNVRAWAPRLALAAVLGAAGFVWSLQQISTEHMDRNTQALVSHQQELLDPSHSTAGTHAGMLTSGVIMGFTHPAGLGLGATTLAAGKFGGEGTGTETDVGDMFVSLGFIGGIMYVGVITLIFRSCLLCWQTTRGVLPLALLGIMTVEQSQWLHAGHYAPITVIWFLVGALDRWQASQQTTATPNISVDSAVEGRKAAR